MTKGSFWPRSGTVLWLLCVGDHRSCNAGTDSRDSRCAVGGRMREIDLSSTVLEWWYEDLRFSCGCKHGQTKVSESW